MQMSYGAYRMAVITFDRNTIISLTGQPEDELHPVLSLAERGGIYEYI